MSKIFPPKTIKKTRKRRVCHHCGEHIDIGESCVNFTGIYDGFYSIFYHPECEEGLDIFINSVYYYEPDGIGENEFYRSGHVPKDELDWQDKMRKANKP